MAMFEARNGAGYHLVARFFARMIVGKGTTLASVHYAKGAPDYYRCQDRRMALIGQEAELTQLALVLLRSFDHGALLAAIDALPKEINAIRRVRGLTVKVMPEMATIVG